MAGDDPDERQGWWPDREPDAKRQGGGGEGEGEAPAPDEDAGAADPGSDEAGASPGDFPPPTKPPLGLESRDRPKVASRYSLFVGLAFIVLAIVAIANAISTDEGGIAGIDPTQRRGFPLPEFALADVSTGIDADANIAQDDCESSRNPCPADQVRQPACAIDDPQAIRICDLFDKPLAISFWFTRGGDCLPSQDAFDAVAGSRGDEVNFLSINILDDRDNVAAIAEQKGWSVPVGHDRDGAVSNLLGIGICPTIVLAYPGGIQYEAETKPGNFTEGEIDGLIDDLVTASAAREPGGGGAG